MAQDNTEIVDGKALSTSRLTWPDFARVIAVFAVVVLHAATCDHDIWNGGGRNLTWQICSIYNSLVRFCVPLFVMISGMFLLAPKKEYPIKKLYLSKILRVATAYIFWAAVYSAFALIELSWRGGATFGHGKLYIFLDGMLKGYYHLWFLPMIAGLYIVTPLLRVIAKNEKLTIYFLVLGAIFVFGVNALALAPGMPKLLNLTVTRLGVKLVAGYSCYFLLGYYLATAQLSRSTRLLIYAAGIVAVIATAVLNGAVGYRLDRAGSWFFGNLLPNTLLTTMAIFVFCRYNLNFNLSEVRQKKIATIGRYSFGIYLVHALFLEILHKNFIFYFQNDPAITIPVASVVVFFVSWAAVWALDQIPVVKKYLI